MCKLTLTDDLQRVVTCTKPDDTQSHLAIETSGCELTLVGRPCATQLQNFIVCSALSDGVTYECLVNTTYTYPVCCLLYEEGSSEPISNSCIPSKSLLMSIMMNYSLVDTTSIEATEGTAGPTGTCVQWIVSIYYLDVCVDTRTASTEQPYRNNTSPGT